MNTITCSRCDLANLETFSTCKRCGSNLGEMPSGVPAVAGPSESASAYRSERYTFDKSHREKKKGLAITSLVLGIAGLPPVGLVLAGVAIFVLGTLFGSAGIVFGGLLALSVLPGGLGSGIAALVKANRRPDLYAGKGLAIAGIATSGVGLLFLPLIAAIAIPNFLAARRAANEGSAVRVMQAVASAQQTYIKNVGNGYCGDIEALAGLTLVDISLAKGERNGYRFYVSNLPGGGCEIHGVPKSSSEGNRSFFYSTAEGQIRAAERNGAPAGSGDPRLGLQNTVRNVRSRDSL